MNNRSFIITFLVPTFALLFLFALYPLGTAIYYALHDWDMRVSEPMSFVGLQNFIDMFRDSRFLNSLKVSAQFLLLTVTGSLALAALVAPVVNEVARGWLRHLVLFVFILPAVLPRIGAAYMWRLMYDPSVGIINYLLSLVNLGPYLFLQNPRTALISIAVIDIWQWGFLLTALVVILLQEVAPETIEAARLDGANTVTLYLRIMYPLILPLSIPLLFIKMMESLRSFDFIFVLTAGGPGIATETLDMYAYWQGMGSSGQVSYASAMSLFMVAVSIFIVTLLWRAMRRWHE